MPRSVRPVASQGLRVGTRVNGQTLSGRPFTGIIYRVSPYGWVALVDDAGKQWIAMPNTTEIVEAGVQEQAMTPVQRAEYRRLSR